MNEWVEKNETTVSHPMMYSCVPVLKTRRCEHITDINERMPNDVKRTIIVSFNMDGVRKCRIP